MADYRDLTGDYEIDYPLLKEMFHSLTTEINIDNQQGQVITHTFTTTAAEVITHDLGKTPVLFTELDKTVAGTIYRSASDADSITLVSSSDSQVLKFYVE